MFIETLEFTIPVELCNVFSSLQKGPTSNVEFPASVNSYGTTQDANVQVVLRSNKLTFKVDGVSSNASMISKSECKTLKLSVFDVDRTLMPQENDNDNYNSNNMSTIQTVQQTVYLSHPAKRLHESSVSMPQPPAKSSRTSFSESPRPRSPVHRRPHSQVSSSPSNHSNQSKSKNDTPVNVKQEPEDPDLIEIEPDHDPDDVVPKKETPYMQIDYSSDVPHTQTSQAALDRLSHPQSSHSQSPGSSSSSFHQNVPHVPDYSEPSTSQARYGDQSADDFLVFQDENDDGDDNEADYSNDDIGKGLGQHLVEETNSDDIDHSLLFHIAADACRGSYGKKMWQCEYCAKTFTNPRNKRLHVEAVHGPGEAAYNCVCGKAYKYTHNLYRHRKHCSVYQLSQQTQQTQQTSSSVQFC
ncbi:zinc finger protein 462-like isoform X19 [Haliotis asinina]|uniref:zinc finger protein 462-like isoform X19 n=1 Tax=Haliotis asinina TaxID=109174 RepID=UPI003531ACCE